VCVRETVPAPPAVKLDVSLTAARTTVNAVVDVNADQESLLRKDVDAEQTVSVETAAT